MKPLLFSILAVIFLALFFGLIEDLQDKKAQDSTPAPKNTPSVKIEPIKTIVW